MFLEKDLNITAVEKDRRAAIVYHDQTLVRHALAMLLKRLAKMKFNYTYRLNYFFNMVKYLKANVKTSISVVKFCRTICSTPSAGPARSEGEQLQDPRPPRRQEHAQEEEIQTETVSADESHAKHFRGAHGRSGRVARRTLPNERPGGNPLHRRHFQGKIRTIVTLMPLSFTNNYSCSRMHLKTATCTASMPTMTRRGCGWGR